MAMFLRSVKTKKHILPSRMLPINGAPRRKNTNYFQYPSHTKHTYDNISETDQQLEETDIISTPNLEDDVFESDSYYSDSEETDTDDEEDSEEETLSSSEIENEYTSDTESDFTTDQFIKFKASQKRALSSSSSDNSFTNLKSYRKSKKLNSSSDSSPIAINTRRKVKNLEASPESSSDEEIQVPGSTESDIYKTHAMIRTPPLTGNGNYNWPWL